MSRRPSHAKETAAPGWRLSSLKEAFAHAPHTLALVWESSRAGTLALGLLTLGSAALPLAIAFTGKAIIDGVVAHDAHATVRWVAVELGLIALQAAFERSLSLVRQTLGARLALDINVRILDKALALELKHFEDPDFYDRLTRARREASSRPVSVVTELFRLGQNVLTLAGYVGVLVGWSGLAVVALMFAAFPAAVSEMRFSGAAFRMRNHRSPDARRLNYLEYVLANDEHAKEVKLFALGRTLLDRYRALGERFYAEDKRLATQRTGWGYALSLLGTFAFYGAYAAMAYSAATGHLTVGQVTLYLVAFRQGQTAFQGCLASLGSMFEDNLYMANLFEYFAMPTGEATLPPITDARDEEGIRFEDVGFRYPGQKGWALQELSLFIPKGRSLALVGHNGAGKTTFIKLLARLYEPTQGRILLDGRDLKSYPPDELRRRIAVVFQDFNRYQFTVGENIGAGDVAHLHDQARWRQAATDGLAAPFVETLPGRYGAQLGSWFKGGRELSGGQWQKLALSRAFMRREADILVLDEPTAAIDAQAEADVFEHFRRLAARRMAILISHRFSTVRMADEILVMRDGVITERGSHAELLHAGGHYARLFTLQAAGYR